MIVLAQTMLVPLAAAFLIGIAAGWWMFRHRRLAAPAGKPQDPPEEKKPQ